MASFDSVQNVENSTSYGFDTYDWEEDLEGVSTLRSYEDIVTVCFPIGIVFGTFFNCLILAVTCRFSLWRFDHGYLYIAANSAVNAAILIFDFGTVFLAIPSINFNILNASEFTCRVWPVLMHVGFVPGWLVAALLINVYLREHLQQRTTCGCPRYAAKYCTLARTKVVIAVIFITNFILSVHCLWTFQLQEYGFDSAHSVQWRCHPSYNTAIMIIQLISLFSSSTFMWLIPVAVVLPIFLILTNCLRRRDASFQFSQIDSRSKDGEEMTRTVLWLSGLVWLTQCPTFIMYFIRMAISYKVGMNLIVVAHVVHCLSLVAQPILCLGLLIRLRQPWLPILRRKFCLWKWCPMFMGQNGEESAELEDSGSSAVLRNSVETFEVEVAPTEDNVTEKAY